MKIAWHTWEPGLTSNNMKTSSGGALWMRYLFDELSTEGHQVSWVSDEKVSISRVGTVSYANAAKQCDVLFAPWRWAMPSYPERNELYARQMGLIAQFAKADKPVMIHDQDHKISEGDENYLKTIGAQVYEPSFYPRDGVRTLHFPQNLEKINNPLSNRPVDLAYVGNNYERFDQVCQLVGGDFSDFRIKFYGNWLDPNPGRQTPDEVKAALPCVTFMGRLPQQQTQTALSMAAATIHFCKESYSEHGFVTFRWAEAAAAGTIPLIPFGFALPALWQMAFWDLGLMVSNSEDVKDTLRNRAKIYDEAIRLSRKFVHRYMSIGHWLNLFE